MIGRLVEQQNVGFGAQRPDQRRPPRFAAGKTPGIGGRVDPEFRHHRSRRVRVVEFAEPAKDIVVGGRKPGRVRLLRQVGEARRRLDEASSTVRRDLPRRNAKQGRFARTVAPNDSDAVTGGNRQVRAVQKRRAAERQNGVSQL